jgi:hypothetical protein
MISEGSAMSTPSKMELSPDVICQPVKDEVILLNLNSQQYYGLDAIGARMLNLLIEHGDVDEVLGCLLKEYAVEESRLSADLNGLVERFLETGVFVLKNT